MIRTLVVEDDELTAEIHASYVARLDGFRVDGIAHRAAEALEIVRTRAIDLILLDFHLPDGQGLDLLRTVRTREDRPIDVIAVTAARDHESIRRAIADGVTQYIVKPFTFKTFADRLDRYAKYRAQLAASTEAEQADVDELLGALRGSQPRGLPKGLNATTLDRVAEALREAAEPLTATQVAAACGLSRVTARRYLEHLVAEGEAELSMRYGGAGRPEHLYATRPAPIT